MGRFRDLLVIVMLNLAAMGALVWHMRDERAGAVRILPPPTSTPGPTATVVILHVYVSGAVASPGVVELPEGARADDAVRAAGGFRPEADAFAVNLASAVADGAQLHVAAIGENPPGAGWGGGLVAGGTAGGAGPDSAAGPSAAPPGSGGGAATVNLNRATAAELEALPGIGPALAERIVAYRTANGPFATVDSLTAVSGIGERTLEKFRDRVAVP